jgi:hypothetical protein
MVNSQADALPRFSFFESSDSSLEFAPVVVLYSRTKARIFLAQHFKFYNRALWPGSPSLRRRAIRFCEVCCRSLGIAWRNPMQKDRTRLVHKKKEEAAESLGHPQLK